MKENIKEKFIFVAKGFCMGTADVIPGVSGGTMAYILGIYERLVNAIKSFDLVWLKGITQLDRKIVFGKPDFALIVPLVSGIILALLFFTRIISLPKLLHTYPEPVYALFFGLIAGSIVILMSHVEKINAKDLVSLIAGTVIGLIVFNLVPVNTPEESWFVFLSGALAICAMILPGISGSFILLILKKYEYIFNAVGYFDFSVLIPFVLGIITGLAAFSRFLSWLLGNFHKATIMVINGLLIASLWVIWPYQERVYEVAGGKLQLVGSSPYLPNAVTTHTFLVIILMVIGVMVVMVMNKLSNNLAVSGD